ncbi:hypothetical protein PSTT_03777 [Puccinia striiformis]|uniref:Uncharacterized protein n=1 Tax=Puccinia striiformis TaxID=27350 RepID=A0A2S4VV63_9BASI|nr:hypothetical protein PSTT_03777 [Puccinia striiformis]
MERGLRNAPEKNTSVQAITDALGADNHDRLNAAGEDTSLDEEDLNEDLLIYLCAIHFQQYSGPCCWLTIDPDNSD